MNGIKEDHRTASERARKRKPRQVMGSMTLRLPKTAMDKIEGTIAEVQGMAEGRKPEKSQVVTWMLTQVKAEDLRERITAWNALFE